MKATTTKTIAFLLVTLAVLAGCGGGGGGSGTNNQPSNGDGGDLFTVGGTVSGLAGSGLVLQNNGADDLPVSANGSFTFVTALGDGSAYNVTVQTQPTSPGQTCTISNGSGTLAGTNVIDVSVSCTINLNVSALYPAGGAQWNDYVKNDGATRYAGSDAACTGTETGGYSACMHGGEMRVVDVPGESTCAGLSASDALDAFDWVCDDSATQVRLISRGLKDGKYLSDLIDIDAAAWKPNAVTVHKNGVVLGASSGSTWWNNLIAVHNIGGNLDAIGTVYLVTANPGASHAIVADKVALVVQPGVKLTGPGTGETLVSVNFRKFAWLEGEFDAINDSSGLLWVGVTFSVARRVHVANAMSVGVWLDGGSNSNRLFDLHAASNGINGVTIGGSSSNLVRGVRAHNNRQSGIALFGSHLNVLSNVTATDNVSESMQLSDSFDNFLTGLTGANAHGVAIALRGGGNNVIFNATAANSANTGILVDASSTQSKRNTLMNVLAFNNWGIGVNLQFTSDNALANLATANNGQRGISLFDASNNKFTGLLKVGGNSQDCAVTGGTSPGLTDGTCANQGASDASLVTGVNSAASMVAKVTLDDSVNLDDVNGLADFDAITDWSGFENSYRGWGRDGNPFPDVFPNANNQGVCVSGETCRIWDWSLANGDTGDAGNPVLQNVLALPSGDDTLTHTWSAADAVACGAIAGAVWDGVSTCTSTFLRHAVEILDDDVGNDNGLCESGERCLYTPNIGSYQGHGELIPAGSFADGTLTGIALFKHEVNGY